jgi:hypothetical protein
MRRLIAALVLGIWAAVPGAAQDPVLPPVTTDPCEVPGHLLFVLGDASLDEVATAVKERRALKILVLGTGSSLLAGAGAKAYPVHLQEALKRRLPDVTVNVATEAKSRLKATDMVAGLEKLLLDRKPDLVVWQTGTVEAMRGVDPDEFRRTLDDGIDVIHEAGADVVLMNMQYSPRTESVLPVASFADTMRVVARDRSVPLFDRLEIMRYWNDNGNFDLNIATKDSAMAQQVHDCIGRALASLIIEAAHLDHMKPNPTQ